MNYYRVLISDLSSNESKGMVKIVFGARQTGKSTLFKMMASSSDVFFNLQDTSVRQRFERDPGAFTRQLLSQPKGHLSVYVDEIQKVPALLDEIQWLYDEHGKRFSFFLTGSSSRQLKSRSTNLLPGRCHIFKLQPVILMEQEHFGDGIGTILPVEIPNKNKLQFPKRSLEDYLINGCLPGIWHTGNPAKTLEAYAEIYIEEEIRREALIRNIGAFGKFLELAAIESGKIINLTRLSQESGIPVSTLSSFYQVLEDTFVGFRIQPCSRSYRKRLIKTPRFLFFDVGVRNAVARFSLDNGLLRTNGGELFEHWVGCELFSRITYLGRSYRISYWRTVDGAEVDFILETPKELIPIEVKYTTNPRPADARGVEHFINYHSDKAKRGFVVCRTQKVEQLTETIQAIPWWMI